MPYSCEDIKRILNETLAADPNVRRNGKLLLSDVNHALRVQVLKANPALARLFAPCNYS